MAEHAKRQGATAQNEDDEMGERKAGEGSAGRSRGSRAEAEPSLPSMVAKQAKAVLEEQVAQRAGKPAADLGKLAKALLLTSEQLDGNFASPLVNKAATQLEHFSQFLQDAKGEDALRSVEEFARKRPWLFLGGAAVVGFGGARFLKSSATRRAPTDNGRGKR